MPDPRLQQLEENLSLLREQLGGMERVLITAPAEEKIRLQQRIRLELRPQIQAFEQEYWQLLATKANSLAIPEPEAEVIVAEIVPEIVAQVGQLEVQQPAPYPAEVLQIWREIRDGLNKPDQPAAAKLKGAISAVPPFINLSYEAELDTEAFLRKYFPTFTRAIKALAKK